MAKSALRVGRRVQSPEPEQAVSPVRQAIEILPTAATTTIGNMRATSTATISATAISATPYDSGATINSAAIVGARAAIVGARIIVTTSAILIVRVTIAAATIISTGCNCTAYNSPSNDCSATISGATIRATAISATATAAADPDLHNLTVISRKSSEKVFGDRKRRTHRWQDKQSRAREARNNQFKPQFAQFHGF